MSSTSPLMIYGPVVTWFAIGKSSFWGILYIELSMPSFSLRKKTYRPSAVEQDRLVAYSQVRDSLVSSAVDTDTLSYFDLGGAELLYEIRLLSATLRVASARRIVERRLDAKDAQQLARVVKDFPHRQGDVGWRRHFSHLSQQTQFSSITAGTEGA